ncbi:MAG: hypothetical protein ACUVTO_02990 [Candidatus Caldatribacteriaceae bacterium]
MAISRCDPGIGVKGEVLAAIMAAVLEFLESERGPRFRPYVARKSHAWKTLALREGRFQIRLGR